MAKETMPLYTYIMSHRGQTKVSQHTHSNYTGFLLTPISAAFHGLKPVFGELMRMRPEPISGIERAWACSLQISGEAFTLHVVETRG
jgi:hypothetical protein